MTSVQVELGHRERPATGDTGAAVTVVMVTFRS
jgi:hypothetical protein